MKGSHLIMLLLLCSVHFTINAQRKWKNMDGYREGLYIGYRADFGGYKEYKNVKRFYNEMRPWLDNSLSESLWMNGVDFGFGTQSSFGGATILNFGFSTRKDKIKGVLPNGEDFSRSIRITQITLDAIDGWWTPIHVGAFDIGFGGMPLGVMWCRFSTKIDGEKPETGAFKKGSFKISNVLKNMDLHSVFHLDVARRSANANTGIRFQLFYQYGWGSTTNDMIILNRELNPNSFQSYHKRTLLQNSHFGFKTLLFL